MTRQQAAEEALPGMVWEHLSWGSVGRIGHLVSITVEDGTVLVELGSWFINRSVRITLHSWTKSGDIRRAVATAARKLRRHADALDKLLAAPR